APPAKPAPAVAARTDRHALLVGVTFYEHLPEPRHLVGPANDVEMMRQILVERFQLSPHQIVTLSPKEGKAKGNDYLPTKANIQREWERLAKVVKDGDYVLIHMGGHGSQQPENPNSPDPEPDGLDEIFLPRDFGTADGGSSTANAIIDDE